MGVSLFKVVVMLLILDLEGLNEWWEVWLGSQDYERVLKSEFRVHIDWVEVFLFYSKLGEGFNVVQ